MSILHRKEICYCYRVILVLVTLSQIFSVIRDAEFRPVHHGLKLYKPEQTLTANEQLLFRDCLLRKLHLHVTPIDIRNHVTGEEKNSSLLWGNFPQLCLGIHFYHWGSLLPKFQNIIKEQEQKLNSPYMIRSLI